MRREARDVTGGEQLVTSMVPGVGFINYILMWFTVPAEVFLRRNFGERYFTRPNFFAGLILLFLIQFAASMLGILSVIFGSSGGADPLMWTIIKIYLALGIFHFLHIWWNDIMGQPVHSFSAGRSWLLPIGKGVMWLLNKILDPLVTLLSNIIPGPGNKEKRLENALPVLQDENTFTERFIEPIFLMWVGSWAGSHGHAAVSLWLVITVIAMIFYTGMRHEAERSYMLDLRDQMIEAKQLQSIINGTPSTVKSGSRSARLDRIIKQTVSEAEQDPSILDTLGNNQPTVSDAISAVLARQKKSTEAA